MKLIPNAIARKVAQQSLNLSASSPTILFGAGVVGMVGSTVLACRATLRLDEVLANTQNDLQTATDMRDLVVEQNEEGSYSEKDLRHDKALIIGRGVGSLAKLYAPSVLLGAASVTCLTRSHHILKERNLALTAAYAAVDGAFKRYRDRVIEEYGEDVDRELRYNSEDVEIVDGETGKVISTVRVTDAPGSVYSVFFDEYSSSNWSPDPDINHLFLRCQQNYANDLLRTRGHVFLNEVYRDLGLPHTTAGAVVGWRWLKGDGDNHIDFGIWDGANERVNDFFNGREGAILLDFNVDGVIYDKLEETS